MHFLYYIQNIIWYVYYRLLFTRGVQLLLRGTSQIDWYIHCYIIHVCTVYNSTTPHTIIDTDNNISI